MHGEQVSECASQGQLDGLFCNMICKDGPVKLHLWLHDPVRICRLLQRSACCQEHDMEDDLQRTQKYISITASMAAKDQVSLQGKSSE